MSYIPTELTWVAMMNRDTNQIILGLCDADGVRFELADGTLGIKYPFHHLPNWEVLPPNHPGDLGFPN